MSNSALRGGSVEIVNDVELSSPLPSLPDSPIASNTNPLQQNDSVAAEQDIQTSSPLPSLPDSPIASNTNPLQQNDSVAAEEDIQTSSPLSSVPDSPNAAPLPEYDLTSPVNDISSLQLSSTTSSSMPTVATDNDKMYSRESCLSDEHQVRVGLDPTMKRIYVGEKIQYEIWIGDHCFITDEVLCDWKADCGTGRATRVWIVHLKGDRDKAFVVKDVWLEERSTREGDTLDAIAKRVEELKGMDSPPPNLEEWFENHLLHKFADQTIGEPVPGICNPRESIYLISRQAASSVMIASIHSGSQRAYSRGRAISANTKSIRASTMPSRFHYRIAFEGGAMKALDAVPDLKSASEAVIGILRGCWVLWKCGYIHRDISSSNALWDPRTKTGRLADFDYTVKIGESRKGTCRTGTPHFWAIEVEQRMFLYLPEAGYDLDALESLDTPLDPPFQHNVLHDLESIYWLSLWITLWLVHCEDMVDGQVSPLRSELYDKVFVCGLAGTAHRERFIGKGSARARILNRYSEAFHNKELRRLVSLYHFSDIPSGLKKLFADAEAVLTISTSVIPSDSAVFEAGFRLMAEKLTKFSQELDVLVDLSARPLRTFQLVLPSEGDPDHLQMPVFYSPSLQPGSEVVESSQSSSKRRKTNDGSKDATSAQAIPRDSTGDNGNDGNKGGE